jgi:hypothetical protein
MPVRGLLANIGESLRFGVGVGVGCGLGFGLCLGVLKNTPSHLCGQTQRAAHMDVRRFSMRQDANEKNPCVSESLG